MCATVLVRVCSPFTTVDTSTSSMPPEPLQHGRPSARSRARRRRSRGSSSTGSGTAGCAGGCPRPSGRGSVATPKTWSSASSSDTLRQYAADHQPELALGGGALALPRDRDRRRPGPMIVWSPLMNDAGSSGTGLGQVAGVVDVVEADAPDLVRAAVRRGEPDGAGGDEQRVVRGLRRLRPARRSGRPRSRAITSAGTSSVSADDAGRRRGPGRRGRGCRYRGRSMVARFMGAFRLSGAGSGQYAGDHAAVAAHLLAGDVRRRLRRPGT